MKTIRLLTLLSLSILIANLSYAQNYKSQFNIDKSGKIQNGKGTQLGTIEQEGIIRDSKGHVLGKVVKSEKGSQLQDPNGHNHGELSADGTLKDQKGNVLFTIGTADQNGICKILDNTGKEVGTVHENYKQQGACAYHCLANKDHKHQ